MNVTSKEICPELFPSHYPEITRWVRVWDELPSQGTIVPVWDGDYIYYASYWERAGEQIWIISNCLSPVPENVDLMKVAGEQVYPIHWLKIKQPRKS